MNRAGAVCTVQFDGHEYVTDTGATQPPDTLTALADAVAETPGARVWLAELLAALERGNRSRTKTERHRKGVGASMVVGLCLSESKLH